MNENKSIGPSHVHEWALNNMDTFPLDDQQRILERFKNLTWIPAMVQELRPWQRWLLKETMKMNIDNGDVPFCLMSISCFSYNLRLNGIDTSDLDDAINTSPRVRAEAEKITFFRAKHGFFFRLLTLKVSLPPIMMLPRR
ncbi:MAG: hypothetical protein AB7V25_00385 [Mangrovibacterium sp.]